MHKYTVITENSHQFITMFRIAWLIYEFGRPTGYSLQFVMGNRSV